MKTIAKYAVWAVIGSLLAEAEIRPFETWHYWAWFAALYVAVIARDWAVHNAIELTDAPQAGRPR